jgi:spore coat protein U-like protein
MKRIILTLSVVSALGLVFTQSATAATATANATMSATVTANCTITAAALNFGSYDPVVAHATTALDVNGTVTVACTKGAATTIGINQGLNAFTGSTAVTPLRQMANGANRLRYDLYRTSAGTGVWGDIATANVASYTSTSKTASILTVFGRIPAGQDVNTGSYSDTIVATISF